MRKVSFFIFVFFSLPFESFSQTDSMLLGTFQGYVVPLVWFDRNPRLRLGMEYHTHDHKSYSLEVGFGNNFLNQSRLDKGVWGQAYSFLEFRPEIKWFVQHDRAFPWTRWWGRSTIPRYFAIEGFYQEMYDLLEQSDFNVKATGENIAYDEAMFKKIKMGIQGKLGFKLFLGKKVIVDVYEGIGLAYRKITYYDVVNPRPVDDFGTNEQWWPESYKNEGAYFLLQFSLGVRIGYVFGKV